MPADHHLVHNAPRGPCAVCGTEGLPCARCRVDYYCGKQHQTQDWQRHRKGCGVLELRVDERLGRHLVATKDIPKGTVIMREQPLVFYPGLRKGEEDVLLCVGCCRVVEDSSQCSGCGWPVCGPGCAKQEVHLPECAAFQRAHYKLSREDLRLLKQDKLDALGALRTCLAFPHQPRLHNLMKDRPEPASPHNATWLLQNLQTMESNIYQAHAHEIFVDQSNAIIRWVRVTAGITWLSEKELFAAVVMNSTNAFSISDRNDQPQQREDRRGRSSSGVFAGMSMLENSCVPNTRTSPMEDASFSLEILVTRDVTCGEHLSTSYAAEDAVFCEKSERQACCISRGFLCLCALCVDPTERGLFLGSWCCVRCSELKKKSVVNESGTCETCGFQDMMPHFDAISEFDQMQQTVVSLPPRKVPHFWQEFVERHLWPRGLLHDTSALILKAKMNFIMSLKLAVNSYRGNLSATPAEMRYWEKACRDVLAALELLRPGLHIMRRKALMVLHCVLILSNNLLMDKYPNPAALPKQTLGKMKAAMKEMSAILEEVKSMSTSPSSKAAFADYATTTSMFS